MKLEEMKKFLNDIDEIRFHPKFSQDKKILYILNPPNEYLEEILKKCDELKITYYMKREPIYDAVDPNTLQRPLIGFSNYQYYFKDKHEI